MIEYFPIYYLDRDGHTRELKAEIEWVRYQHGNWLGSLRAKDHLGNIKFSGPYCSAFPNHTYGKETKWDYYIQTGPNTGQVVKRGVCNHIQDVRDEVQSIMVHIMMYNNLELKVDERMRQLENQVKRLKAQLRNWTKPQGSGEYLCPTCNHFADEVFETSLDLCVGCYTATTNHPPEEYLPLG